MICSELVTQLEASPEHCVRQPCSCRHALEVHMTGKHAQLLDRYAQCRWLMSLMSTVHRRP